MSATQETTATYDGPVAPITPRRTRIDPLHSLVESQTDQPLAGEEPAAEALSEIPILDPVVAGQAYLEVEEPTAEMMTAVAGQNLAIRREQLQLQVAQLAGHLRDRLREVDRREAALNARVAELESDLRASRMWLRERELEFQQRETELQREIEALRESTSSRRIESDFSVIDPEARAAELSDREQQLQLHEDELRERRFEVDRQGAALRHAQQLWQQQREREERALSEQRQRDAQQAADERALAAQELEQLTAQREQQLSAGEALLCEHALQLDRDRAALLADRQRWDTHHAREQQAIEGLRADVEAELSDRRARLDSRQQWIERQKSGLEQVRDEALKLHRQSLEMRLLAEQLWSQITGNLTPAEVTQTIAQLRLKLAEQYRIEEQQLVSRRDELVELSERMAGQHRELDQLKSGVRQWAAARQREIEQQASALVTRELALDQQQEQSRQSQQQWHAERRRYEQQIRDLTSQLRALPAAA